MKAPKQSVSRASAANGAVTERPAISESPNRDAQDNELHALRNRLLNQILKNQQRRSRLPQEILAPTPKGALGTEPTPAPVRQEAG